MHKEIYWEEESNSVSNFFTLLTGIINFLYLRFILSALIGIALMSGGFVKWFALTLTTFLSIITFLFLSEQVKNIIVKATLKYSLNEEGISFRYWLGSNKTITIPYENIISFHTLKIGKNITTDKIYFNLTPAIDVNEYAHFSDGDINLICFDDIKEIDLVSDILREKIKNNETQEFSILQPEYLIKDTSQFSYVMNTIALVYLFIGFYLFLANVDRFVLPSYQVVDTINQIETLYYGEGGDSYGRKIHTTDNYTFNVKGTSFSPGTKLNLEVTPIFKNVTSASVSETQIIRVPHFDGLIPGAQILCSFLLLFCSVYIIRKNGVLAIQDTLFFIILPLFLLLITYYL